MKKFDKIVLMNDNNLKIRDIIIIGEITMRKFMEFLQGVLMINNNDDRRVGLSQFRDLPEDFSINKGSITSKDVKLSDLLRRA